MPATATVDFSATLDQLEGEIKTSIDKVSDITARTILEKRDFSKDEEAAIKEQQDGIVAKRRRVETIKSVIANSDAESRTGKPKADPPNPAAVDPDVEQKKTEKRYNEAFVKYARYGFGGISAEQQRDLQRGAMALPEDSREARALSSITGTTGGFTIPTGFASSIEVAMKDYSGVLQAGVTQLSTETGNDLPFPTLNDTSNEGSQIEENNVVTENNVTGFGQITLRAFTFSSRLILLPLALIQDSGIDIQKLIGGIAAERLGRIINRRLTTGNGANQPQGLATAAPVGKTAASGSAVTYPELIDLTTSIDPAYWPKAAWEFNAATFGVLQKMVDSDGRPIWMPAMNSSIAGGAPGLLCNKPYSINQNMASMASGAKSMLYGDHSKYLVRRVKDMVLIRLTERYADAMQVGFFVFARLDGRLLDAGTNPIKAMSHT